MVRSLELFGSLVLFGLIVMVLGMSFLALVAPAGAGSDAFFGAAPDNLKNVLGANQVLELPHSQVAQR